MMILKGEISLTCKINKKRIAIISLCVLIALTVGFIFSNSIKSKAESGEMSHGLSDFLQSILDPAHKIDRDTFHMVVRKLAHFAEFFLLGAELAVLRYLLCGRYFGVGIFSVAFTLLAVANADEFIQSFTGRGSQVSDSLIDFSGGATGALSALLTVYIITSAVAKSKAGRVKPLQILKKKHGARRAKRPRA